MGLATCLRWGVCSQPDLVLFLPFPSTALLSFRFCVYDNYSNKGFVISIYLKELTRYKIIEKIFCKSDFCCLWRGKERLESKPSLLHSNTLYRLAGKSPHLMVQTSNTPITLPGFSSALGLVSVQKYRGYRWPCNTEVWVFLGPNLNTQVSQQEAAEPQYLVHCCLKITSCYHFIDPSARGGQNYIRLWSRVLTSRCRFCPRHLQCTHNVSRIQHVSRWCIWYNLFFRQ